jgi:hypothetical protein
LCAASPEEFIADIIRVHSKNSWFTYLTPPRLRASLIASRSAQARGAFLDRINRIRKIPPNHLPSKKNDFAVTDFAALSPSALTDTPLQHRAWHEDCSALPVPLILQPIILPKNPISSFPF